MRKRFLNLGRTNPTKAVLILCILLLSPFAKSDLAEVYGKKINVDLEVLVELNKSAHQILPYNQDLNHHTNEFEFMRLLNENLVNRAFRTQIESLQNEIAQFLTSGGIFFFSNENYDKITSHETNISALSQIQNIHPLLVLLTRSIVFKSHEEFVKSSESLFGNQLRMGVVMLIPGVNVVYGLYVLASGENIRKKLSDNQNRYYIFQQCALSTMTNKIMENALTCGTEESQELVPHFRKFTLGAILINMFYQTQKNRMESTYTSLAIGEGTFLEQMNLLWENGIEKSGISLSPGEGFLNPIKYELLDIK